MILKIHKLQNSPAAAAEASGSGFGKRKRKQKSKSKSKMEEVDAPVIFANAEEEFLADVKLK